MTLVDSKNNNGGTSSTEGLEDLMFPNSTLVSRTEDLIIIEDFPGTPQRAAAVPDPKPEDKGDHHNVPGFEMVERNLADLGGLYWEKETEYEVDFVWLSAPFEVVGRVRDPRSYSWARLLRWKDDDGVLHEHAVTEADLHGDVAALCRILADGGLRITTAPTLRSHFVRYLNSVFPKKRITIVARTGWHDIGGNKRFVLPDSDDGDDQILIEGAAVSPYTVAGTLEQWRDSVGRLADGHTRPMFCVSAAFAAPLLSLVGDEGGGFNLKGLSSIGKTTVMGAASSVWGCGNERGLIRTWRATGNGVEGTAALYSDTLLPLDELGIASSSEVGNIVYSVASGVGKQRAKQDGSARAPRTWRVMVLSSGELGVVDKIREGGGRARAGQEIRIIDIEADAGKGFGIFDSGGSGGDAEKLAASIKTAAQQNYGTAGRVFVRAIEDEGIDKVVDAALAARAALVAQMAGASRNGQVLRAANRFALVGVAGEMAIDFGVVPWAKGTAAGAARVLFKCWRDGRGGGDDPAEVRSAIEQIRHLIDQHGESRFDHVARGVDTRPVINRLGWVRGDGEGREWLIPSTVWTTTFCEGFDAKMVAGALAERGILKPDSDGKTSRSEWVDGKTIRVYVVTSKIRDEEGPHV